MCRYITAVTAGIGSSVTVIGRITSLHSHVASMMEIKNKEMEKKKRETKL